MTQVLTRGWVYGTQILDTDFKYFYSHYPLNPSNTAPKQTSLKATWVTASERKDIRLGY